MAQRIILQEKVEPKQVPQMRITIHFPMSKDLRDSRIKQLTNRFLNLGNRYSEARAKAGAKVPVVMSSQILTTKYLAEDEVRDLVHDIASGREHFFETEILR